MTEDEHQAEPRAPPHDLVYKVPAQNDEPPPPAADGELPEFWTEVVGQAISEYVAPFRHQLNKQQREISELRGQVSALLVLLGAKAADVVPLSGGRKPAS